MWPKLRHYPRIFLKGLSTTTKNLSILGVPAAIPGGRLQKRCELATVLGKLY
jgi:hypothetical protein